LIDAAKAAVRQHCQDHVLLVLDWSLLHYKHHPSKADRTALANSDDLGYRLLTALAVSDTTGHPLAPVCLELEAADGLHTTRSPKTLQSSSSLDDLSPVLQHVAGLQLGRPSVVIIDREGDSIQHLRQWSTLDKSFVVRAKDAPRVVYDGRVQPLKEVAKQVPLTQAREVLHKGVRATQYIGETRVRIERPARTHRFIDGVKRHRNIAGAPLALRLIVSEVRDAKGKVLAQWLLFSNLPAEIPAERIALWYYWRWNIDSYHKLLKQAGQHLESWQQDDAEQIARRLAVVAMSAILVWQLARDPRPEADQLRQILVRLSGRLMKRGKGQPGFTEPALLAGLGVLLPMLEMLKTHDAAELKRLLLQVLPVPLSSASG
jgi:hypothetical protein